MNLQVPLPDFVFADIAKDKALFIIKHLFHDNSLNQFISGSNPGLLLRLENQLADLQMVKN